MRPRSTGTGLAMGMGKEGMTRWRRKEVDGQSGGGTGWIEPIQIPVRDDLIDLLSLPYKTDNNKIPISPDSLDHQRTNIIENRRDCAICTTASSASQTRSVDRCNKHRKYGHHACIMTRSAAEHHRTSAIHLINPGSRACERHTQCHRRCTSDSARRSCWPLL